jgi:uncharacterized protein YigE (DUF2233 family)
MKRIKILLIIILTVGTCGVFAQNVTIGEYSSSVKTGTQDTLNTTISRDTPPLTQQPVLNTERDIDSIPASIDLVTSQDSAPLTKKQNPVENDSAFAGSVNRDYQCLYNTCSSKLLERKKKITQLKKEIKVLQQKLDSLQAVLRDMMNTDSTSVYTININDIDNLPVNINFQDKSYSVYIVNPHKNKINLYNKKEGGGFYDFASINKHLNRQGKVMLFAMNAGMYMKNREPEGLFIQNGEIRKPLNLKKEIPGPSNFYNLRPNGVFAIDELNNPYVVVTEDFPELAKREHISLATQSGPMLVIKGEINAHFTEGSRNLHIRNGVGINQNGKVVFVVSNEPVNFYEFSQLFRDVLNCDDALYLDGAISQMYLPELNKKYLQNNPPLGPIITVEK